MYWPYFRSKMNEVLAVNELASKLAGLVVPVIKPVNNVRTLEMRLSGIAQQGVRVAVVVNSNEGAPVPTHRAVASMVSTLNSRVPNMVFPAFEIGASTAASDVNSFCSTYSQDQTVIIHRNHHISSGAIASSLSSLTIPPVHIFFDQGIAGSTINGISSSRKVLLRDGFQKQQVNGAYPRSSNFGDLVYTFGSGGFQGFGDCGTVGDIFQSGGGAPSHVALHLTEEVNGPTLACNHFVSTVPTATDTETKYLDALDKLVHHTGSPGRGQFGTEGVTDFCGSHANTHFPGLGVPKRWSLKHHIEMMNKILQRNGVIPFV